MAGMLPTGGGKPQEDGNARQAVARDGEQANEAPQAPTEEPSAEEQQVYESVVANATKAIYSGETADMIVEMMQPGEGKFPVEQLAGVIAPMMVGIEASASESGVPVSREMTVQAAMEIIEDIGTELLPAAGLDPLGEGEIEGAFLRAMEYIGADSKAVQEGAAQMAAGAPEGQGGQGGQGGQQAGQGEPPPAGPRGMMPAGQGGM